jgi:hypothetical protein
MEYVTYEDFCRQFDREETCMEAWLKWKWPNGYRCPKCRCSRAYLLRSRKRLLYECRSCGHQTSLIAGTILEGSRVPLRLWFRAIFLHTQHSGISAVRLAQIIGVTYKTAWLMGHKIRHAMSRQDEKHRLLGLIRITPAKYGRAYNPTIYRHPREHPLLIGASLNGSGQPVYVKIKQVANEDACYRTADLSAIWKFKDLHVNALSGEVISDVGRYIEERSKPLIRIGKSVEKWLNDAFRGIGHKHLQAYLDQYCFFMNGHLRNSPPVEQCLNCCAHEKKTTLRELVARPANVPKTPHYDRWIRAKRKKAG